MLTKIGADCRFETWNEGMRKSLAPARLSGKLCCSWPCVQDEVYIPPAMAFVVIAAFQLEF